MSRPFLQHNSGGYGVMTGYASQHFTALQFSGQYKYMQINHFVVESTPGRLAYELRHCKNVESFPSHIRPIKWC